MRVNAHVGLWAVVGALALAAEVWEPALFPWVFAAGVFVEIWAAVDSTEGNTLSEVVWCFKQPGDWAKAFFVAGLAVWISWRFAFLNGPPDFARAALAVGLCLWLVIHFIWRGRYG